MKTECKTCKFWQKPDEQDANESQPGTCHRHAPEPCYGQESEEVSWPMTYVDDWCGEWRNLNQDDLEETADPELLNRSIKTLMFSTRIRNSMELEGVDTLRDLINKTENQLLSYRNFGIAALNEVKVKLAELGLKLRG